MAGNVGGRGTALSIPWGSASPLDKTQDVESGRSAGTNGSATIGANDGMTMPDIQRRVQRIRVGTWNVGSLRSKSEEVANALEKRKVKICCLQETRWKGEGAIVLVTENTKYKLWWSGGEKALNGCGCMIEEEFADKVVEVKRVSDRLMMIKLIVGKSLVNIISAYAPQVGRSQEEKDKFWDKVCELMEGIKDSEMIVLGGDLNGHVGRRSDGYEGVHGGHGYGERNAEGETILEFCVATEMILCGTQFQKENNKLISYSSGGCNTTVDYLMVRERDRGRVADAKAFPGEEIVAQHRLMVCDLNVKRRAVRREKYRPKMKLWSLKDPVARERFEEILVLGDEGENVNQKWEEGKRGLLRAAEEVCGWTKGPRRHVQTWWWCDEVKEAIEVKKAKHKDWQRSKGTQEEAGMKREYLVAKKASKKAVYLAKNRVAKEFGKKLNTKEGKRSVYRIAKQMASERRDVVGANCLKSEGGEILFDDEKVRKRWKEYMEKLLNVENDWDGVVESEAVLSCAELICEKEILEAIQAMKSGKSGGPTGVVAELLKAAGKKGVRMMVDLCNCIVAEEIMPKDWELSILKPIYKGKGDPMACGSHRAVKLLEHAMKIMERVLEKRLRGKIRVGEMQFGFMPGKGTVDAIFVVRQLQEKHMEKKKDLFFAFVDLEKAFDRVPREVVRWALRQLGVEEWLVRTVMVMYGKARTIVRSNGGDSEEFEVGVGVHQGSVLSPLLFVAVMEVLTRDVRQGLPWELLYADDLILVADSMDELGDKMVRWKDCMERKGLKVNIGKTKVMRSGKGGGEREKVGKWPCSVCKKGVGENSIQCTSCNCWVHKRCSGVTGSLTAARDRGFVCKICDGTGAEQDGIEDLELGSGEVFEGVRKFCYLGDMINGEGGSDSASIMRVRSGWAKFRELSGVLKGKWVNLKLKGKVYAACVRSVMIYGSETWAITGEQRERLERTEMKMVRWMCGVSLRERKTSKELRRMMGIEAIGELVQRARLRWAGHVLRKENTDGVKKCMDMEIEGNRGRGRPKLTWGKLLEKDMQSKGLVKEDAGDRIKWRKLSRLGKDQPPKNRLQGLSRPQ